MNSFPTPQTASVPLSSVIATDELFRRPVNRKPDYEAQSRALTALAEVLTKSPDDLPQGLAETSLKLCRAHSAGISLVDESEGQKIFRWRAIAGQWASHIGVTTPRSFSPCGVVLDRNSAQLFVRFDRHYPYFNGMSRPAYEALLLPFSVDGDALGTIWVLSHDNTRRFDTEDLRLLGIVAKFASAAFGLMASLEKRRQADRYMDVFLATLAHELRGPLAPLSAGLQVMGKASGDAKAIDQARGIMERQLGQLVRLVDDLLDVNRIRLGMVRLNLGRAEVATVLRNAMETTRPSIEERGHDLTIDVPREPLPVRGDAARLAQVFANLLSNAAKYTERGGHIRLTVARRDPNIVVTVKDDGVGISAQMLPRVFDVFVQAERSLDKAQGGLGLGLHIAKRLVELHGGSIEARSDGEGLGSEFIVTLPLAHSLAPLAGAQCTAESPRQ
jgi:signal transduction histidine kinase